MRISAKADYAVRAAVEMAAAGDEPVKGEKLAEAQDIPLQFLEHILLELKHARLVRARRGARGGYWLARPPEEITLANVIRAVEGPLANIQDQAPEATKYPGHAEGLTELLSDPLVSGPMFDLPKPIEVSTISAWVRDCQAAPSFTPAPPTTTQSDLNPNLLAISASGSPSPTSFKARW